MDFGLIINHYNYPNIPTTLTRIAQTAEDAGFSSVWVLDHLFQMDTVAPVEEPMLEAYNTLSYLAGQTTTIQLGVLVTGVVYRHPGFLVKSVTTLDVLSGGRAWLGIGAAWYEREARGLGIPFPPLKTRFEWLEDTLQIAETMWADTVTPYQGRHFALAEPLNSPQSLQRPHPPILIGGAGEKKTLRMVAQYANASNFDTGMGDDALSHKLTVLRGHCDALGRDYDSIRKTLVADMGNMSPAAYRQRCDTWAAMGFDKVIVRLPDIHMLDPVIALGAALTK